MLMLIIGLLVFLGVHSLRISGENWRTALIATRGEGPYKGVYSLVSAIGLGLLIWGYGLARQEPVVLWQPMGWTRHLAALLMLISFVMLAAAYVPGNGIKSALKHPMVLGVKVWALAHLLSNNTLADVLLFGGFLVWAVVDFRSARQRDRKAGTVYASGSLPRTVLTVVLGLLVWVVFSFWAHGLLIGVKPMG
jgi:uncharacterized membrane protein